MRYKVAELHEISLGAVSLIKNLLPKLLNGRKEIVYKPDGSPVSSSDILLEETLVDYIRARLEGIEFISEESVVTQSVRPTDANLLAVIDPIDGTENFVSGLREWGVSISFWSRGRHQFSFLYLPEFDEYIDSLTKVNRLSSRIKAFSSSMCEEISNELNKGGENRISGCAVFNHINVLKGRYASFYNPKGAWVWDMLGGVNIALANGLSVTVDGVPYNGEFVDTDCKHSFKIY